MRCVLAICQKFCYNGYFAFGVVVERWFEFMGNHPFLFGLLALFAVLFFMVESKRGGKKIAPSELGLLVNNEHAKLIDVRPANKFVTGHIQGSQNIPFAELPKHLETLKASTTPIIVVCDLGMQAGTAVALIGKPNVYRLEGGIANWQASGMPLVGKKS